MRFLAIGIGKAGSRIVNELVETEKKMPTKTFTPLVFNTSKADSIGLNNIKDDRKFIVGESLRGQGTGGDSKLGAEVAAEEIDKITSRIEQYQRSEHDAILLVAGLGGGTGGGMLPVFARELSDRSDVPIYGLGVLPSRDEGEVYALNAARSIKTSIGDLNGLILVDNSAFVSPREGSSGYEKVNKEIAKRMTLLSRAGEVSPGGEVGEKIIDASEVLNTIGRGGITTLGYSMEQVETKKGFLGILKRKEEVGDLGKTTRIVSIIRRAVKGKLTLPCDYRSAERALVLVAGSPELLSRMGTDKARKWLESEIVGHDVRAGDYPIPRAHFVAAVVALSGLTDVPRIRELFEVASEFQRKEEESRRGFDLPPL
ncbi:cell division protein [Thermococci archaeon]|nr:MAG: cell division protein [Thermococci archaeon]